MELHENLQLDTLNQVDNTASSAQPARNNYEVVFYIKYRKNPMPSLSELVLLFEKYGSVHHITHFNDRNYAFVFMSSLKTDVQYRRTRTTIGQIIRDMTPETHFHISVANSNGLNNKSNSYRSNQNNTSYRHNRTHKPSRYNEQYRRDRYNRNVRSYESDRQNDNSKNRYNHNNDRVNLLP